MPFLGCMSGVKGQNWCTKYLEYHIRKRKIVAGKRVDVEELFNSALEAPSLGTVYELTRHVTRWRRTP